MASEHRPLVDKKSLQQIWSHVYFEKMYLSSAHRASTLILKIS